MPRLSTAVRDTAPIANDAEYRRQLDGLRALAVFGVLVSHLTAFGDNGGGYGVALFFVLSGYLITGILLRCRALVESGQSLLVTLRQFYIRRALRILPIVYLVLAIGWLLGDPEIRRLIWWHLGYVSNFLFAAQGYPAKTAHFWSLAVEEQFYVIWPLFIILCPRRALAGTIGILILGSALFRVVSEEWVIRFPEMLTPTVSDALCFGALLILAEDDRRLAKLIAWCGPPAALIAGAAFINVVPIDNGSVLSAVFFCRGLAFAWLVGLAARGTTPVLGPLLEAPALAYIGKISYGIYVYHPFIDALYAHLAEKFQLQSAHWLLRFGLVTLASIGLAALSWRFFEAPINALKRHFRYSVSAKPPILAAPVSEPPPH